FFLTCHGPHRHLPPFPTRRSSDLLPEGGDQCLLAARVDHLVVELEVADQRRVVGDEGRIAGQELPLAAGFRRTEEVCVFVEFGPDRKSTRLNSSHSQISYAVFCLK